MTREDKLQRIDKKFIEDLRRESRRRIQNDLEVDVLGMREMTRIARNAPSYKELLKELGTLQRRKNGK